MNRRLSDVTTPSPFSLVFVNLVLLTLCYHCQIRRTLLSSGVVLVDETGGNLPDPRISWWHTTVPALTDDLLPPTRQS